MRKLFWALHAAFLGCYQYSQAHPQSLVWGAMLIFGGLTGAGDVLMGAVGAVALLGALVGMVKAMLGGYNRTG